MFSSILCCTFNCNIVNIIVFLQDISLGSFKKTKAYRGVGESDSDKQGFPLWRTLFIACYVFKVN